MPIADINWFLSQCYPIVFPITLLVLMVMRKEEIYVAIWCVLMPVTGTLVMPSIQGTVPAYMMAFSSVYFIYLKVDSGEIPGVVMQYVKVFVAVFLLWLFLLVASQAGLIISNRHDFGQAHMVDPSDTAVLFRTSMFTQSLYFFACVMIALYFRYFFQENWMRYIHWGGYFLAGYGIYEWSYFLIFQESGDFLVNRAFGEGHIASWSQAITFGGINLLRIKSTLGEPTFFAAAVLPFLFLALDAKKWVLSAMLLFTAAFSTSTACFLTLPAVLLIKSFWGGRIRWTYLLVLTLVGFFLGGMALLYPDTFRGLFEDKFSGENDSGSTRLTIQMDLADLLGTFSFSDWLFGIGFGYTYLTIDDGLLVNSGLIGLGVFLWVFGRACWLLPQAPGYEGLKAGLLSFLILSRLSLSELYLPTTWMFLGLAYYKIQEYAEARYAAAYAIPDTVSRVESSPRPVAPHLVH